MNTEIPQEDTREISKPIEYAGFWVRFGAMALDCIILGPIGFILGKILPFTAWVNDNIVETAFLLLAVWFNSSRYQGTPGKIILSIQVTDMNGNRISLWRSLMRYLIYYPFRVLQMLGLGGMFITLGQGGSAALMFLVLFTISGFLPAIGYLMVGFTARKQGLHDKLCRTLVIRK